MRRSAPSRGVPNVVGKSALQGGSTSKHLNRPGTRDEGLMGEQDKQLGDSGTNMGMGMCMSVSMDLSVAHFALYAARHEYEVDEGFALTIVRKVY